MANFALGRELATSVVSLNSLFCPAEIHATGPLVAEFSLSPFANVLDLGISAKGFAGKGVVSRGRLQPSLLSGTVCRLPQLGCLPGQESGQVAHRRCLEEPSKFRVSLFPDAFVQKHPGQRRLGADGLGQALGLGQSFG